MDAASRDRPDRHGPARDDPREPRLAPVPGRRALVVALGRTLLSVAAVLALYAVLPLTSRPGLETLLALVAGLLAFGLIVTWQVRAILRSRHPALQAVEAVAVSIPLFLVVFAGACLVVAAGDPDAFSEPLSRIDGLYFVVTVFATVGFGDIAPVSDAARVLTTVQMVGDLVLIGLVLRVILAAVDRRRREEPAGAGPS
ncbi:MULTISPECIES: potassium channel family protein [unclassified Geodermatophilus]